MIGEEHVDAGVRERLAALEASGCRDVTVEVGGAGSRCRMTLPDGRGAEGVGSTPSEAAVAAADRAELMIAEGV